MKILGIDEAGRGCVLGDLFIASFLVEVEDCPALSAAGATDSKRLSARRRREVRELLSPLGKVEIHRITPAEIDSGNINALEERAICELIRAARPDRVILDALGPPSGFAAVLRRLAQGVSPLRLQWTLEPKADLHHPPCGAASIFAKVARDEALDTLKASHGDLGSGYPSDPKTRAWLRAHAQTGAPWPPFVRTRWGTIAQIEAELEQNG